MAAIAIGGRAKATGAVGAALLQLVVQMLGFPAPVAVIGMTVMAAALLISLRRHLRLNGR
jgi:hypothetical protein